MEQYTNPIIVKRQFNKFGYKKDGSDLKQSTRKGKKWMVFNPNTQKWVHFGALGYEDYTVHKDKERRKKYHQRMGRFSNADKYSPGYLSLVLLW
jgi:hypothetical protein